MVLRPVKCVPEPIEVIIQTPEEITAYFNADKLFRCLNDSSFTKKTDLMSRLKQTKVTIIFDRGQQQITLELR